MRRRRTLALGGAALLGVGAGVGTAWRRSITNADADGAPAPSKTDFWSARPIRPDGTPLDLAGFRGRPLLVNFWATWCVPCVTELPLLDGFQAAQRAVVNGWQVVALAVDSAANVGRFLATAPLQLPVGILDASAYHLPRLLGNTGGGLPFSVVLDAQGRIATSHLGAVDQDLLERWVASLN